MKKTNTTVGCSATDDDDDDDDDDDGGGDGDMKTLSCVPTNYSLHIKICNWLWPT